MTYFEKNAALLCPAVLKDLDTGSNIEARISDEIAENGQLTACITTEKKSFYVHSQKAPSCEVEQWVRNTDVRERGVFLVLGFGLGYHIEALLQKCYGLDDVKIIVVEPFKELLIRAMQRRDLSGLLSDPRLHLITETSEHGLAQHMSTILPLSLLIEGNVSVLVIESLVYNLPVYVEVVKRVRRYMNTVSVNRNTVSDYSMDWTNNTFENLTSFLESRPVSNLFGKFKDIPVILVAAGPSLDKNIHLLSEAKGKAVIISVGTAVKSLCKHGVEPEFVFSIDGGARQLEMFQSVELKETWLCYVPAVYPRVPELFPENKFVMDSGFSVEWLAKVAGDIGMITSGPSVANFAFDFARKIGGNPIIMIGQDLALRDNRTHAMGTIHENNTIQDTTNLVKVDGIDGGKVFTRRDFLAMLAWFQTEIEQLDSSTKVVDATEGGALIAGIEVMTLRHALDQYVGNEYNIADMIRQNSGSKLIQSLDIASLKQEVNEILVECDEVKSLARKGYRNSIELQTIFTMNKASEKKLARLYDKIIAALKDVNGKRYFASIASMSLSGTNNRLEEAIVAAKKYPHSSKEWGIIFAKGYQRYFEEIREVIEVIQPFLNRAVEYLDGDTSTAV